MNESIMQSMQKGLVQDHIVMSHRLEIDRAALVSFACGYSSDGTSESASIPRLVRMHTRSCRLYQRDQQQ